MPVTKKKYFLALIFLSVIAVWLTGMRHVSFDCRLTLMQSLARFMFIAWYHVGLSHTFALFLPPSALPHSRSLSQGSANAAVLDVAQAGGHKKRVRRSSFLNAKKLYEDAQMARKVKQYLSNLDLEMDEESLQILSLQCEPATNTCEHCHLMWMSRKLFTITLFLVQWINWEQWWSRKLFV